MADHVFDNSGVTVSKQTACHASSSPESGANKGPAHKKAGGRLDERKVARRLRAGSLNRLISSKLEL